MPSTNYNKEVTHHFDRSGLRKERNVMKLINSKSGWLRTSTIALCACFIAIPVLPLASFESQALSSATFTYTYNSAAGAKNIPNPGTVQVPIAVGDSVTAARVDVSVGITHGRSGDLNVWVASPAGVQQQIVGAGSAAYKKP